MVAIRRRACAKKQAQFADNVPPLLQRIYGNRNLLSDDDISLSLSGLLPPDKLLGLSAAVALLSDCVHNNKKILIVGDFDADGATSCAVAIRALKAFGHSKVSFLVPNRFDYGYGLTPEIVDLAARQSDVLPALIVTVDNGIASVDGVNRARELGISVLVTDHHLPGDELPEADAIVNPNQSGCQFESKNLAGVGVIFYVMAALRAALISSGWFERNSLMPPKMTEFLDLVALGTVADVVPLDRNNRILVEQGLRRIRQGLGCEGIKALISIARRKSSELVASDFGFALAPRINAAGRLDDISIGIALLLTNDAALATELSSELDGMNRDRRQIEAGMKLEAERYITAMLSGGPAADTLDKLPTGICLYDEQWHQGVVGILASRIKERYHRPVICFAPVADSEGSHTTGVLINGGSIKGSARSITGLHMRDALDLVAKRYPGLLSKFGGHAMAAGLELPRQHFDRFSQAFDAVAKELLSAEDLQAVIETDGQLNEPDIDIGNAELIRRAQPWGQKMPEPLFDGEFTIRQQKLVGENHLKLRLAGIDRPDWNFDAIAFNVDTALWPDTTANKIHIVYALDVNEFRGLRNVQLLIKHIKPVR